MGLDVVPSRDTKNAMEITGLPTRSTSTNLERGKRDQL